MTNKVFFPERIEGNIKVNSNWFTNLEYSWDRSNPKSNSANMFGVGILVNESGSQLFSGTTMQAFYKRAVNKNLIIRFLTTNQTWIQMINATFGGR